MNISLNKPMQIDDIKVSTNFNWTVNIDDILKNFNLEKYIYKTSFKKKYVFQSFNLNTFININLLDYKLIKPEIEERSLLIPLFELKSYCGKNISKIFLGFSDLNKGKIKEDIYFSENKPFLIENSIKSSKAIVYLEKDEITDFFCTNLRLLIYNEIKTNKIVVYAFLNLNMERNNVLFINNKELFVNYNSKLNENLKRKIKLIEINFNLSILKNRKLTEKFTIEAIKNDVIEEYNIFLPSFTYNYNPSINLTYLKVKIIPKGNLFSVNKFYLIEDCDKLILPSEVKEFCLIIPNKLQKDSILRDSYL